MKNQSHSENSDIKYGKYCEIQQIVAGEKNLIVCRKNCKFCERIMEGREFCENIAKGKKISSKDYRRNGNFIKGSQKKNKLCQRIMEEMGLSSKHYGMGLLSKHCKWNYFHQWVAKIMAISSTDYEKAQIFIKESFKKSKFLQRIKKKECNFPQKMCVKGS